jgi:uncharacterized protein YegL
VSHARTKIASAADAAALAAGRARLDGALSDAEVEALGEKYFMENMSGGGNYADVNSVDVTLDREAGSVTINVDAEVPMTITRMRGFTKVGLPIAAATVFDQSDIELGMALDVTGSMSGQKIADLRAAAKDLVDILLPGAGATNKVRIGLAPYAASVNAGSYAATVTNGRSTNGCVHERGGSDAFTDALPEDGSTWLGFRNSLSCPSARIVPMTDDKTTLKTAIDGYRAGGSTAGHIGTAWAWYLVSPEWASLWPTASAPVAYHDGKTLKAIILMTDGEFNTQYVGANGNSDTQARSLCTDMKSKDVIVYTVGFQSPAAAEATLQACATSETHYFKATNGSELHDAFVAIAQQLNNLRLTN